MSFHKDARPLVPRVGLRMPLSRRDLRLMKGDINNSLIGKEIMFIKKHPNKGSRGFVRTIDSHGTLTIEVNNEYSSMTTAKPHEIMLRPVQTVDDMSSSIEVDPSGSKTPPPDPINEEDINTAWDPKYNPSLVELQSSALSNEGPAQSSSSSSDPPLDESLSTPTEDMQWMLDTSLYIHGPLKVSIKGKTNICSAEGVEDQKIRVSDYQGQYLCDPGQLTPTRPFRRDSRSRKPLVVCYHPGELYGKKWRVESIGDDFCEVMIETTSKSKLIP